MSDGGDDLVETGGPDEELGVVWQAIRDGLPRFLQANASTGPSRRGHLRNDIDLNQNAIRVFDKETS